MPPLVSSQFSPQFLRQLQTFRHEHFLCDCRLVVAVGANATGNEDSESPTISGSGFSDAATLEFPAHRLILAASSPFFKDLFALKRQETMTTVNLNNCSPECLEVILQFLYSGELELRNCNPQQVLNVARMCQIKPLEHILSTLTNQNGIHTPPGALEPPIGSSVQSAIASKIENDESRTPYSTSKKHSLATGAIKRKLAENADKRQKTTAATNGSPASFLGNFFTKFCNKHSLFGCNCASHPSLIGQNGNATNGERGMENLDENASEASSVPYEPSPKVQIHSAAESPRPTASPSFSSFIADHENSKNSIFPAPNVKFTPTPHSASTIPHGFPLSMIGRSTPSSLPPTPSPGVSAELPLSQQPGAGNFPEPNNPRPGYYGPLLPTTTNQLTTAAALASAYLAHSANAAAAAGNFAPGNIFPALFPRPPPGGHVTSSLFPPLFARRADGTPMAASATKPVRHAGVNAMMASPSAAQVAVQNAISPTEEAHITVPSSEKEGWCRNKKYIQKVPNGYQCTVCNKTYGRYNSVSYHVTIYHRNPPIRCDEPQCQFTTREARYIHFHKYYRHGTPLPKSIDLNSRSCPFCRHVAKSPAMLEKHVNRHMPDCIKIGKAYKCNQCGMDVPDQQSMVKHMMAHTNEEKTLLRCDQCSYKGKTESSLNQHKLFKHSSDMFQRKYICEECGYSGPTQTNLSAHKALVHKQETDPEINLILEDAEPIQDSDDDSSSIGSHQLKIEASPASIASLGFRFSEISENGSLDLSQESPPPRTPPPSCATSAESAENNANGAAEGNNGNSSMETDLDDSHSKLASEVTTGYHSMVDYGTV